MLFWWICGGESVLPVLLLRHLGSSLRLYLLLTEGFHGGSDSKESACNARDLVSLPELGDSLKKEMATHSSILAWRIPWPSNLACYSPWSHKRVRHNWATNTLRFLTELYTFHALYLQALHLWTLPTAVWNYLLFKFQKVSKSNVLGNYLHRIYIKNRY